MNASKNKNIVGQIANSLSIAFLFMLFNSLFSFRKTATENVVLCAILLFPILFILIGARTLKREGRQTKLSIIGKSVALFFSLVSIVIVARGQISLSRWENISDFLFALSVAFSVIHSFYLFRTSGEKIESVTQQEVTQTKISLKLPPHAWDE